MMKPQILACLFLSSAASAAEEAPDLAQANKLVNTTMRKLSQGNSAIAELIEKEYRARTNLELQLRGLDQDFAKKHAAYVDSRAKMTNEDDASKKAYATARDAMIADLIVKAKAEAKVAAKLKDWHEATDTVQDKVATELAKTDADKAEAFKKALVLVRAAR